MSSPREDPPPLVRRVVALHRRDRQRAAAARGDHLHEQVELRVEPVRPAHHVEVADRLEHAVAEPDERLGDAGELARADLRRRRRSAARGAVVVGAPGREPGGAGDQRVAHHAPHRRDVVLGRGLVGARALAHDVHPHGVVRDLEQEVDRVRPRVDRGHVIGERLPAPRDALGERGAGDVLDAFHQLDQLDLAARHDRREADPATAHHARRHAVQRGRRELGVPRHLAVVVGVDVDEPGQDVRAARVDRAPRHIGAVADRGDPPARDRDVAGERRASGSVDDRSAGDLEVVHLPSFTL
jgi:hypothetical protein